MGDRCPHIAHSPLVPARCLTRRGVQGASALARQSGWRTAHQARRVCRRIENRGWTADGLTILVLLLWSSTAHAAQAVDVSNMAVTYMDPANPWSGQCSPSDPYCPHGPLVSYTVTNNTDAPIVAHVRCTIYDATGAPISARSVWTPVKPHDTSFVDSVAFFQTPPMLTKVERFDCVVERVSTDPTTSNN